jgi:hypothetical protein
MLRENNNSRFPSHPFLTWAIHNFLRLFGDEETLIEISHFRGFMKIFFLKWQSSRKTKTIEKFCFEANNTLELLRLMGFENSRDSCFGRKTFQIQLTTKHQMKSKSTKKVSGKLRLVFTCKKMRTCKQIQLLLFPWRLIYYWLFGTINVEKDELMDGWMSEARSRGQANQSKGNIMCKMSQQAWFIESFGDGSTVVFDLTWDATRLEKERKWNSLWKKLDTCMW